MRFSKVLAELSTTLTLMNPRDVAEVRRVFSQGAAYYAAETERRRRDGGKLDPPDLAAFFPRELARETREVVTAASREIQRRGNEWAIAHLLDAVYNFIPQLAPEKPVAPRELNADEKREAAEAAALAELEAADREADEAIKRAEERRARLEGFRRPQLPTTEGGAKS